MLSFQEILLEKVNDDNLYHLVGIEKLKQILKTDRIDGTISLTRNKLMNSVVGTDVKRFQIVFSKEKLKNNYKITPFSDRSTGVPDHLKDLGYVETTYTQSNSESEERIVNLKNASKYIVQINLINVSFFKQLRRSAERMLNKSKVDMEDALDTINYINEIKDIISQIKRKFKFGIMDGLKSLDEKAFMAELDDTLKLYEKITSK